MRWFPLATGLAMALFGLLWLGWSALPGRAEQAIAEYYVRVQIQGAVKHPGVYRLPTGSRIAELVWRAGGPRKDAQLKNINLAEPLVDGEMCYVPTVKESAAGVPALVHAAPLPAKHGGAGLKASGAVPAHKLNLNRATVEQLAELPGIGPGLAASIVRARTTRGRFASIEELREIGGFGAKRLERLKPYLAVN